MVKPEAGGMPPLVVDPIKLSPPLGATLALLGIDGAAVVMHGGQGCAAFAKSLLTNHFREPIPLYTTALRQEHVIMGAEGSLHQALQAVIHKHGPRVVGLVTTALTETSGDDVTGMVDRFRSLHRDAPPIIPVFAPDFSGSLTTGYVKALHAVLDHLERTWEGSGERANRNCRTVNLVFGPNATPADVEETKDLFVEFGYEPLALPDLSGSLDGHLGTGVSPTTAGGVSLAALERLREAALTFSFARSVDAVAKRIAALTHSQPIAVAPQNTLLTIDGLVETLMTVSGRPVSPRRLLERDRLKDRMLDARAWFAGRRVVLAGEPDVVHFLEHGLTAMGARVVGSFSPVSAKSSGHHANWRVGDFDQLERYCRHLPTGDYPDLLIANSHGRPTAEKLGLAFWSLGFPVQDRIGAPNECSVGYRGAHWWIAQAANIIMAAETHDPLRE